MYKSFVILLLLSMVISSFGGGWTSCNNYGYQTRTVELGVYNTKEKCGQYCGGSCTTECGQTIYSYGCFHHQPQFPNYRCECTCAIHCPEI